MLGKHGLWAKKLSTRRICACADDSRSADGDIECDSVDNRLVGWQDIMPTLLQLAGIPIPDSVRGLSMLSDTRRDMLYGELGRGVQATRMVHMGRQADLLSCRQPSAAFDLKKTRKSWSILRVVPRRPVCERRRKPC